MKMFHILIITCVILSIGLGILYWDLTKDMCKDINIKEFLDGCKQGIQFGYVIWIIGSIGITLLALLWNKLDDQRTPFYYPREEK